VTLVPWVPRGHARTIEPDCCKENPHEGPDLVALPA